MGPADGMTLIPQRVNRGVGGDRARPAARASRDTMSGSRRPEANRQRVSARHDPGDVVRAAGLVGADPGDVAEIRDP